MTVSSTGSSGQSPDQKVMQRRLKAIARRPENQTCCDCSDPKPTWATLIKPPPDVKDVTPQVLGAMCCYNCAGHHRSLGTHICRTKSCNLDIWTEEEVQAMELGGNGRVNSIFEATMVFDSVKPNAMSDTALRVNFIREKYGSRNFYDGSRYRELQQPSFPANDSDNETWETMDPLSPRKISRSFRRGSFSSQDNDSFQNNSFRSTEFNDGDLRDTIGFVSPKKVPQKQQQPWRGSLTYGELFEPSEQGDDDQNDFLCLTHSHRQPDEGDTADSTEFDDNDDEEDLFADSETTATDLFGSPSNFFKKKATIPPKPPAPPAISEDSAEWEDFTPNLSAGPDAFDTSPGVLSRKSVGTTKSAPADFGRNNYQERWRELKVKSPKAKSAAKKDRRSRVGLSLDAWLDTDGDGEPMPITACSNSPTTGTAQPHRHSTISSGRRSSMQESPASRRRRSDYSKRISAPPAFANDFGFQTTEGEGVEGEMDLAGFDTDFANAFPTTGDVPKSPGNLSLKSSPALSGRDLDSFFESGEGGEFRSNPSTPKRSSRRSTRRLSSTGSQGSHKSAPSSSRSLREVKPPLSAGGKSRRSVSRRMSNDSKTSSSSPTGVMDLKDSSEDDRKSSRSERRSPRSSSTSRRSSRGTGTLRSSSPSQHRSKSRSSSIDRARPPTTPTRQRRSKAKSELRVD